MHVTGRTLRLFARFLLVVAGATPLAARPLRATTAADLCAPTASACTLTGTRRVDPGSTLDFGARPVVLAPGAELDVGPGSMTIRAASLTLEPRALLLARGTTATPTGGPIAVSTTGGVAVRADGTGRAEMRLDGRAGGGTLVLVAGGDVVLEGTLALEGSGVEGYGGGFTVIADGRAALARGSVTRVSGGADGAGGAVSILAGSIGVDALIDATGGYSDGGTIILDARADLEVAANALLDADATAPLGYGGGVDLTARGAIAIAGQITGRGAGSLDEGGGYGGSLAVLAGGGVDVAAAALLDFSGARPDGGGGEIDIEAGTDLVQSGPLVARGRGEDSEGGNVYLSAGRHVTLGSIDARGGVNFSGNYVDAVAGGTLTVLGELDASAGTGGFVTLDALAVRVRGTVRASSVDDTAGGCVDVSACDIEIESGARLETVGPFGLNFLEVSRRMLIAAGSTLRAGESNILLYGPLALPPVIDPAAVIVPPAVPELFADEPPCPVPPGCGDGQRGAGEECDDGNENPCDGCGPRCTIEACGNGVVDCGEQCEAGVQPPFGPPCDEPTCRLERPCATHPLLTCPALPPNGEPYTVGIGVEGSTIFRLGAWATTVAWDTAVLRVEAIGAGTTPGLDMPPRCAIDERAGIAACESLQGIGGSGPLGTVEIARLTLGPVDRVPDASALRVRARWVLGHDGGVACSGGDASAVCESVCGDVTQDGRVDIADGLQVGQYTVGLRACGAPPFIQPAVCDVNPLRQGDGTCNVGDALRLAQCTVGLIGCDFECGSFACP
jgi:cysteine-rich repeat protein